MDTMTKTTEDMTSFGQANVDAIMKAGQAWAAAMQAISQTIATNAQAQLDHTLSTWQALSNARTLKEAVDLQTSLARRSIETALADTNKLTEASMRLAEQAIAPLTARMTQTIERFTNNTN